MPVAEPDETACWLLVLGSNSDAERQLDAALSTLGALAEVDGVSRRLWGEDVGGGRRPYLNQIVGLRTRLERQALHDAVKAIERDAGRSSLRMDSGHCDLDIDLLARVTAGGTVEWLAEKPRRIPAVATLLREHDGLLSDSAAPDGGTPAELAGEPDSLR